MSASSFMLNEKVYADVREGWNQKIKASSQKLSGLMPFVELYAVFEKDDVIFSDHGAGGPRFSDIADRAIEVQFEYTVGSTVGPDGKQTRGRTMDAKQFADRFDISPQSKIVPIASSALSQTQPDSIVGRSYKGYAGINDLAVTRGASGPMNIKYDLNLTLPNPELINEMYEYSKLMILGSSFLVTYGWNPHGFDYENGPVAPPKVVPGVPAEHNRIALNSSNGGFYKSSLVKLYRFNYSLDNVGHLGGKISFLTMAGNYMVATRTGAIAAQVKKALTAYSGMVGVEFNTGGSGDLSARGTEAAAEADEMIAMAKAQQEKTHVYATMWINSIQRRQKAHNYMESNPGAGDKWSNNIDPMDAGADTWNSQWEPRETPSSQEIEQYNNFTGISMVPGVNSPMGDDVRGTYKENPNPTDWEIEDWPPFGRGENGDFIESGFRPRITKSSERDQTARPMARDADGKNFKGLAFTNWLLAKYTNTKEEVLGFMDIDNGIPWAMPKNVLASDAFKDAKSGDLPIGAPGTELSTLDTMPAYGKDLMNNLWNKYKEIGNPNREIFFPVNPEEPGEDVLLRDFGKRKNEDLNDEPFLDPEMAKIMKKSSTISTMLLTVAPQPETEEVGFFEEVIEDWFGWTGIPETQEDRDAAAAEVEEEADRTLQLDDQLTKALERLSIYDSPIAGIEDKFDPSITARFITMAQPVYYLLGAVLEAVTVAMGEKIPFVFSEIPLEGEISPGGFSIPLPTVNTQAIASAEAALKDAATALADWKKDVSDAQIIRKGGGTHDPGHSEEQHADYMEKIPMNEDEEPMSDAQILGEIQRRDNDIIIEGQKIEVLLQRNQGAMSHLQCKTVFELPVDIGKVRGILNEGNAPLHNMINKILRACDSTTKIMKLATRPYAADETHLEIFVANIKVDGLATEVMHDLDIHAFLSERDVTINPGSYGLTHHQVSIAREGGGEGYDPKAVAAARTQALGAIFSKKAVLCEFGTERSLVESFSLSSKVDPNAFAAFRLPEIVGGQIIDIAGLIRGTVGNSTMGLLNDMTEILRKGFFVGKEEARNLKIISGDGREIKVNSFNLQSFLEATGPEATKVQTTFISNLMASDQNFNTKVMSLQNEGITGSGGTGNTPSNNAFFGGVLSSYLRTISLTIHGTIGLAMFNVVYIKGLMRGIEGLYLITSVNESVTPGAFSTSLECKLIQYKDTGPNNPLAESNKKNITLRAFAEEVKGAETYDDIWPEEYQQLFAQTEENMEKDRTVGAPPG